ncbi:DsbA family protein [Methylocella sp.]|uniref:DsbA family protein n=1 Tax=Methylocella sp. TaxID=1978226 RepID=UPI0035B2172F
MLADPQTPVGGARDGDLTIVAFLDYNCPYCMKSAAALRDFMRADGRVRLVYKDWPILGPVSEDAARLALAAQYQGKYEAAHEALMSGARKTSAEQARRLLAAAGVDMARLDRDLAARAGEIDAILKRTEKQADAMQFAGTPVYLIGPLLVAAPLDRAGFEDAAREARMREAEARAAKAR